MRVRTSVLRRQNTVAQFVATRPILTLYEGSEQRGGTRSPQRWWEQKGLDLELAREWAKDAETVGTANDDMAGAETTAPATAAEATTTESVTGAERWTEGEESLGASGSSGAEWSGAETE